MKQYLAGIKGNIVACKKVSHDFQYQIQENLNKISKRRQQIQKYLEESVAILEGEATEEERGSSLLPKSPSSDAHHLLLDVKETGAYLNRFIQLKRRSYDPLDFTSIEMVDFWFAHKYRLKYVGDDDEVLECEEVGAFEMEGFSG
ncbi:hypothetical protein M5K25_021810 [Dendrobium thyrsiflorum]|uniref:Uncharacterized protein n=1 Tax=Dendrobium thyrsiflorum TaxID=117978 RepID=A0ABD0UAP2_DENTH